MTKYEVRRSAVADAPPEKVHALINDFLEWTKWSPWEDLDPDLKRTYSVPSGGPGAVYTWSGNRKAGTGSMEILESTPTRIDAVVNFVKPFKATNPTSFILTPEGTGTRIEWVLSGENTGLGAIFFKFVSMDKMLGPDFEKGLARLAKAASAS